MKTIEKAKRYDEALKAAIVAHKDEDRHLKATLERIFPELKESDDEKIRKGLIEYFLACKCENISSYHGISTNDILAWLEKQGEQKPSWSEEDEKKNEDEAIRSNPIPELPSSAFRLGFKLGWFKVLKERVQSNQEWKQENTDDLTDFENALMHIGDSFFGQHAGLNPNDTNAIKEQANILLGLVPKEWSEEEENNFKKAIKVLRVNNFHNTADMLQEMKYKLIPMEETNNWKPSDKQMNALKDACDKHWEPDGLDPLYTLWKQLKKLKG